MTHITKTEDKVCKDDNGNIQLEVCWREMKDCNECKCRCNPDGSEKPLCACTHKRCHGTNKTSGVKEPEVKEAR